MSVGGLDHGGTQCAALPSVSAAQDLGDDRIAAVAWLVGHRFGDLGIERLPVEIEGFETLLLQLAEHLAEQRTDFLRVSEERGFGRVEYRQQRLGQSPGRPVRVGLRPRVRLLAEVVEVGLDALRHRLELIALLDHATDVDGDLTCWIRANAVAAVLSRPDGYVFGTADSIDAVPLLLDELAERLR